ncbi:MAG: hypothetical protein A2V93_10230 [Ignavibacteria bacterium RBG_16_34_14]|nr:MAG: hypothetical protein A2V93_10230 [Ignavibacteria bacterium RBG_16_34_14]
MFQKSFSSSRISYKTLEDENDWGWSGMRVLYEILEDENDFWNKESSDQIIYLTDIFREILIKSELCSLTPQHLNKK